MVAIGRAEVMIDPIVNLWDAACLLPIIEEAGGQFSDWKGNADDPGRRGGGDKRAGRPGSAGDDPADQ